MLCIASTPEFFFNERKFLLAADEKIKENYIQIIRKADQITALVTNLFTATLEELEQLSVTPEDSLMNGSSSSFTPPPKSSMQTARQPSLISAKSSICVSAYLYELAKMLLYALSGMDTPSLGKITFGETVISGLGQDALAVFRREHCGFVFQQIYLVDGMSAERISCVTITMLCPCSWNFVSVFSTSSPVLELSAPVGSSANRISGRLISARTILGW